MDTYLRNEMVMMWQIFSYGNTDEKAKQMFSERFRLKDEALEDAVASTKALIAENEPRRAFVMSFMHYTGENYRKLDSKQMWKVYCQADGFGYRRASDLRKLNGGWDSSHIRDSTIDGFKRMEKVLERFGFKREE